MHALELLARVREMSAMFRRLLQTRLAHLVVSHATHLLVHLHPEARLALLLERGHALLRVPQGRESLRLHRALVHLVDLLHAKREGGVVVEVVRLGLHFAPGVDAAHVGDALKQLQQERRLGSVDGALGKVARDGAA